MARRGVQAQEADHLPGQRRTPGLHLRAREIDQIFICLKNKKFANFAFFIICLLHIFLYCRKVYNLFKIILYLKYIFKFSLINVVYFRLEEIT